MTAAHSVMPDIPDARDATAPHSQAVFEEFRKLMARQARWDARHPILAKLLHLPIIGARLRNRRQLYVDRASARKK